MLNDKNVSKLDKVKDILDKRDIIYDEYANGQLQVDGVNFWCTSQKWYDPKNGEKGVGMNSFIKYIS